MMPPVLYREISAKEITSSSGEKILPSPDYQIKEVIETNIVHRCFNLP